MFTLDSVSEHCRLCERIGFYASHGPVETKLCFKIKEMHSTYRPSPPTDLTRCYIGVGRSTSEQHPERMWYGEWDAGIDVGPVVQSSRRDVSPERVALPIVSSSTGDRKALEMIHRWVGECSKNHKTCYTHLDPSVDGRNHTVSRLISIEKQDRLRLIESNKASEAKTMRRLRYATLTHKWGYKGLPVLTRANKDALSRRIGLLSLPRTFRDAIRVCQFLAIPYLWIDTLCIVQDDNIEKAHEIANMGRIYAHACLNIGALAAAETYADHGLFSNRSDYAEERNPICARVRRSDFDELCYIDTPVPPEGLNLRTLMLRGWVLQERLLSPCSVYFDDYELRWECSELLASEFHPCGAPYESEAEYSPRVWGNEAPFRMGSLLSFSRTIADRRIFVIQHNERLSWTSKYQCWMKVVEVFSECNLAHSSDGLLAVSGLAKYFAHEFED